MISQGKNGIRSSMTLAILAYALVFGLLVSCEKPPVDQIIGAEKTIREANDNKAHLYAPDLYKKADDELARAKNFVRMKKYQDAARSAELSVRYARQSMDLAPMGRERYKELADTAVSEMEGKLVELKDMIGNTGKKHTRKKREDLCGPFIEKWTSELESLREKRETLEPYDLYSAVQTTRGLFAKELKDLRTSLSGKRIKP